MKCLELGLIGSLRNHNKIIGSISKDLFSNFTKLGNTERNSVNHSNNKVAVQGQVKAAGNGLRRQLRQFEFLTATVVLTG